MAEKCSICDGSTVVYLDSTDRSINSFKSTDGRSKFVICGGCTLKFLLGYIQSRYSTDPNVQAQYKLTTETFRKSELPPGF